MGRLGLCAGLVTALGSFPGVAGTIGPEEAAAHVGEASTVCGIIASALLPSADPVREHRRREVVSARADGGWERGHHGARCARASHQGAASCSTLAISRTALPPMGVSSLDAFPEPHADAGPFLPRRGYSEPGAFSHACKRWTWTDARTARKKP